MRGKLKVSEYSPRRQKAKEILRKRQKRIRNKEKLLTVEQAERMTEFLMKEGIINADCN